MNYNKTKRRNDHDLFILFQWSRLHENVHWAGLGQGISKQEVNILPWHITKWTPSVCVRTHARVCTYPYICTHTHIHHIQIYTIDTYLNSLSSVIPVALHNLTWFLPLATLTQFLLSKNSAPNWCLSDNFLNVIPFRSILELDKFLEINWVLILWSPKKETTCPALLSGWAHSVILNPRPALRPAFQKTSLNLNRKSARGRALPQTLRAAPVSPLTRCVTLGII